MNRYIHNLKNTHTHTQSTNNNNFGCKTQMEQEINPKKNPNISYSNFLQHAFTSLITLKFPFSNLSF
jgi:hypothetical protein